MHFELQFTFLFSVPSTYSDHNYEECLQRDDYEEVFRSPYSYGGFYIPYSYYSADALPPGGKKKKICRIKIRFVLKYSVAASSNGSTNKPSISGFVNEKLCST